MLETCGHLHKENIMILGREEKSQVLVACGTSPDPTALGQQRRRQTGTPGWPMRAASALSTPKTPQEGACR